MNNNQTAFDIDELYFKANNDMAVILNMVRIASLSKKKKGKLLAAIEQKILDTMGGYIDSVDDEDLQLDMCEATLPINYEGSDYADDEDGFIEASVDGILAEYERKKSEKEVSDNTVDRYFVNEDEEAFCAGGLKITAKLLAEALHSLPDEKRQAVLLYYFFDMTDVEIAELMKVPRSTVQYRRTSSFELLKRYLEERADEWDEL